MDSYSNINADVCNRKTICNTSVTHSKTLACSSVCRGWVGLSSEIL